jgi:hypothetical protein
MEIDPKGKGEIRETLPNELQSALVNDYFLHARKGLGFKPRRISMTR